MAKRKNKIFDDAKGVENSPPLANIQNTAEAEVQEESIVESLPDDMTELTKIDEYLSEISRLKVELNNCKQLIEKLEIEKMQLQSDNDQLLLKLSEISEKNAALECKNAALECDLKTKIQTLPPIQSINTSQPSSKNQNNIRSKNVNYIRYDNNGYGTW